MQFKCSPVLGSMKKSILIFLLLWGSGIFLHAEDTPRRWTIGFHPGLSFPMGTTNDSQLESPFYQTSVEYHVAPKYSVGLDVGVAPGHSLEGFISADSDLDGTPEILEGTSGADVRVYQLTPFIKRGKIGDWGTWDARWVRSYILLGAGLYHTQIERGNYSVSGVGSSGSKISGAPVPIKPEPDTHFGFNIGMGIGSRVWRRYQIGFDLRYHRLFKNTTDWEYFVPSLRLSRLF